MSGHRLLLAVDGDRPYGYPATGSKRPKAAAVWVEGQWQRRPGGGCGLLDTGSSIPGSRRGTEQECLSSIVVEGSSLREPAFEGTPVLRIQGSDY